MPRPPLKPRELSQEPRAAARVHLHPHAVAAQRRSHLLMACLGLAGALLAALHAFAGRVTGLDLCLLLGGYLATLGLGLSVGFHRHFTHGSFRAPLAVRCALAALGSMGAQGPLCYWVAVHRRHHELADREGDPHSPHVPGGLWHAHFAWALEAGLPNAAHYCPDLLREPALLAIHRGYRAWVVAGLALPAALGGLLEGSWSGALGGFLWGGLVRLFLSAHATWSLNSFCHRFGTRAFATRDRSTNNAWLALPTLGEAWHNNHHAQPASAAHGVRWWQLDLNYLAICALERLGLVHDVKRPVGLRA